jgi:hypothetical protein
MDDYFLNEVLAIPSTKAYDTNGKSAATLKNTIFTFQLTLLCDNLKYKQNEVSNQSCREGAHSAFS